MATAIFLAGLAIGGAIREEWIIPADHDMHTFGIAPILLIIYDAFALIAKFKS